MLSIKNILEDDEEGTERGRIEMATVEDLVKNKYNKDNLVGAYLETIKDNKESAKKDAYTMIERSGLLREKGDVYRPLIEATKMGNYHEVIKIMLAYCYLQGKRIVTDIYQDMKEGPNFIELTGTVWWLSFQTSGLAKDLRETNCIKEIKVKLSTDSNKRTLSFDDFYTIIIKHWDKKFENYRKIHGYFTKALQIKRELKYGQKCLNNKIREAGGITESDCVYHCLDPKSSAQNIKFVYNYLKKYNREKWTDTKNGFKVFYKYMVGISNTISFAKDNYKEIFEKRKNDLKTPIE